MSVIGFIRDLLALLLWFLRLFSTHHLVLFPGCLYHGFFHDFQLSGVYVRYIEGKGLSDIVLLERHSTYCIGQSKVLPI